MNRLSATILVLAASVSLGAESVTFLRVQPQVFESRLQANPATEAERLRILKAEFLSAGCEPEHLQEQSVPHSATPNLICTFPGTGEGTIVVDAPMSYKGKGEDAQAAWAALVALPLLAESLSHVRHTETLVFIAFSGDRGGEIGAAWYLRKLDPRGKRSIRAMVQVESLGRSAASYSFAGPKGDRLEERLMAAATILHLPKLPARESDSRVHAAGMTAFTNLYLPAITFDSPPYTESPLQRSGLPPVRTPKTALDINEYDQSYRLLCVFLLYLDRGLQIPKPPAVPPAAEIADTQSSKPPAEVMAQPLPAAETAVVVPSQVPSEPSPEVNVTPMVASVPTFRANSSLVQIDVVATDSHGQTVLGLTKKDFVVIDNRKHIELAAVDFHDAAAKRDQLSLVAPTPVTNNIVQAAQQGWSQQNIIILVDGINTENVDQVTARKQLLKYLLQLPPTARASIYLLAPSNITRLTTFTDDPRVLADAVQQIILRPSTLLPSAQHEIDMAPSKLATSGDPAGEAMRENIIALEQTTKNIVAAERLEVRISSTLQALEFISDQVALMPGRKNLIWLSNAFPLTLNPDVSPQNPYSNAKGGGLKRTNDVGGVINADQKFAGSRDYSDRLRSVTQKLAASRIAIYPIAVNGLQGGTILAASESGQNADQTVTARSLGNRMDRDNLFRDQSQDALKLLAEETGGRAYYNRNGFVHAINNAVEDGTKYYTLSYAVTEPPKKGSAQKLEVRCSRGNVQLRYSKSVFLRVEESAQQPSVQQFALLDGVPATEISLSAYVTNRVVYLAIDPRDLTPQPSQDGEVFPLTIAYSIQPQKIAVEQANFPRGSMQLNAVVKNSERDSLGDHGIGFSLPLPALTEPTTLRLVVRDRNSGRVGSIELSVAASSVPTPAH